MFRPIVLNLSTIRFFISDLQCNSEVKVLRRMRKVPKLLFTCNKYFLSIA